MLLECMCFALISIISEYQFLLDGIRLSNLYQLDCSSLKFTLNLVTSEKFGDRLFSRSYRTPVANLWFTVMVF